MHEEIVESLAFGRIGAQTAKQIIVQKVGEAEQAKIVDGFQTSWVSYCPEKKVTRDNIIIDLGNNAEALLQETEQSDVKLSDGGS